MIDLGIVQLPLEALNVVVIVTALLLAAGWLGFDIIASIGGVLAIAYGLRIAFYEYEVVLSGYQLGTYEGCLLVIVGGFLLYRGADSFLTGGDMNTWR